MLRTLVLGSRHPGAHADYLLTPDEVADVMLDGVGSLPIHTGKGLTCSSRSCASGSRRTART